MPPQGPPWHPLGGAVREATQPGGSRPEECWVLATARQAQTSIVRMVPACESAAGKDGDDPVGRRSHNPPQ
eukprot:317790-Prymnesium_polylepis.2